MRRVLHLVERGVKASGRVVRFPDPYREGSWYGNDTVWRMVHDLHTVLFYADAEGVVRDVPQRRYFRTGLRDRGGRGGRADETEPEAFRTPDRRREPGRRGFRLLPADGIRRAENTASEEHDRPVGAPRRALSARSISVVSNEGRWKQLFDLSRGQTLSFTAPDGWAGVVELRP